MSSKFGVDYAKRTAKCKKCQQHLLKGDLRMWRMVPNPFTADSGNPTEMKNYFHVECLFETLTRCRATTKVIDSPDDIEGWDVANDNDKESIIEKIRDLSELRLTKFGDKVKISTSSPSKDTPKSIIPEDKTSKKGKDDKAKTTTPSRKKTKNETAEKTSKEMTSGKAGSSKLKVPNIKSEPSATEIMESEDSFPTMKSKFDMFKLFCKLCDVIASVSKYTEKTTAVKIFINKGMIR
ncbi:DNA ligase 3 [Dirofilaria immitis]|nr:DNA ligase 3 [Dirofilaria immitis]